MALRRLIVKSRVRASVMGHTSPDNSKNYFRLYELIKLAIKTRFLILVGESCSAGVIQPNGDDLL